MNPDIQTSALRRYHSIALVTLVAVYFLILVGSSVRATGAGMGCPDWPTCFGQWIPPITEAELPANYQEIYAELGYAETRFNAVKTWTEYANRLTGVSIGLLILLTAIYSWPLRKHYPAITYASIAAFLMVGFQGWLGAKVVSSNLQPGMITIHMLMALAIVATLLFALAQARRGTLSTLSVADFDPRVQRWLYIVMGFTVLQVAMGTQVREMTDFISTMQRDAPRSTWIEYMPWVFYVHRSFSALVLAANLWLLRLLVGSLGWEHPVVRLSLALIVVVGCAILSGATLGHLGMPAFVQPAHLLAASLIFGLQFLIWMSFRHMRIEATEAT
ncbi:MAG: COX15/CtaA family protein [Pseudomonadota bacterium]|nr:COX15/CtaA family protein [Pseudomonadota bacterium]